MSNRKAKGKSWGVNLNQRTGDAIGGPGAVFGGQGAVTIGNSNDFYGGSATSGSIGNVTVGK
jgi:hypothetical protein